MPLWKPVAILVSVVALGASAWFALGAEGGEPISNLIHRKMGEEAAKTRFTGRMGEFLVLPLGEDAGANVFGCAGNQPMTQVLPGDELAGAELWSPAFTDGGVGWACPEEGIVIVNNEGGDGHVAYGDGSALSRAYINALPIPLIRDAPKERLELITVEGHAALLERPVDGYPYAKANLAVLERAPSGEAQGIVVFVEFAPSAEAAVKHAEEIMP